MNDNGPFVYVTKPQQQQQQQQQEQRSLLLVKVSYEWQLKYLMQSCNCIKFITSKIICGVILIRKRLMI